LAEQFRERQVRKVYWTLVAGQVDPAEGVWHDWLRKVVDEARAEIVPKDVPDARHAETAYRTLLFAGARTLLQLEPATGRMHQLRIQAATRGHPIDGDILYGSTESFGPPAELRRDQLIALHARSLTFLHPIRYEPVTIAASLPEYWPVAIREFSDSKECNTSETSP
jgi:23S rRNA pseudouridine1911/1915/1917 synthase